MSLFYFAACVLGTYLGVSSLLSPIIVGLCRRKNARPVAFVGGILLSLSLLFTSFASQFHQLYISIGLMFAVGSTSTAMASSFMIGQYFKRRRELVEIITQSGAGIGLLFLSVFYNNVME